VTQDDLIQGILLGLMAGTLVLFFVLLGTFIGILVTFL